MPLSSGSIVQSATGTSGAGGTVASFAVTLGSPVTAGSQVIVAAQISGTGWTAVPTGWARDVAYMSQPRMLLFRRSDATAGASIAGETTWTLTPTLASKYNWICYEVADLDADPLEVSATSNNNVEPQTTGTTTQTSSYDTMVLAVHGAYNSVGTVSPSWSGQTNGFVEDLEVATSTGAAGNGAIAASFKFPGDVGTFESSATSNDATNNGTGGMVLVYRSATTLSQASIAYHTGFEFGHAGGIGVGPATATLATGSAGATIVAGSAKNGSYGLRLTASAAAAHLNISGLAANILPTAKDGGVQGFWVRPVSATGTVALAGMTDGATPGTVSALELVYDSSTTQLGVRWVKSDGTSPGAITYQTGTTALNTWVLVSLAYWGAKGATRSMAWSLDGVAQTALTSATGAVANFLSQVSLGRAIAAGSTWAADFDDWRVSVNKNDHPLGDQRVVLLKVDAAGTVTLSGTTTNFQVFTGATPTLAAWNATTARDRTDEVPPGLGASADGFAQILAAASDYVETPMETYTLAAGEIVVAVRALVAGWAAGASAIGLRGYDGTTETTLWSASDPSFNNSSTAPGWLAKTWTITGRWTQAKLDAAALRLGFGTSATDIGAHALYLEVVIGSTTRQTLFGDASTADYDPGGNYAVTEIDITGPTGGDTTLYYETNTTPTNVTVPAGTSLTQPIDEPSAGTTNYIAAYWPPEGVPDA